MVSDTTREAVAEAITAHQAWRSWAETPDGWYCGGCERRYPTDQFDAHIADAAIQALGLTQATDRIRAAASSEASKSWRDLLSQSADEAYGRNQAGEHLLCEIARLPWVGLVVGQPEEQQ